MTRQREKATNSRHKVIVVASVIILYTCLQLASCAYPYSADDSNVSVTTTPERKLKQPAVLEIIERAREQLFLDRDDKS